MPIWIRDNLTLKLRGTVPEVMLKNAHARDNARFGASWDLAAVTGLEVICATESCETVRDEVLGRHTSMGVGGPTPLMVWPNHPEAVAKVLEWCADRGLEWRILGGGSNVLVSDAGVIEPVVNLTSLINGANIQATTAKLPAGMPTAQALRTTLRSGLAGLVWSTGLPGTIGGAVAGNAGCWNGQMADVVARIDLIDTAGKWQTLDSNELTWSYRRLQLPETVGPSAVIVSATVNVRSEDPSKLTSRSYKLQQLKRENQPVGVRNTGCIFKNPDLDHPAGWLIEQASCKGIGIGNAQISTLHGNFLINRGGATSTDIGTLIAQVQTAVKEQTGIVLEEEICRW